MSDPFEGILPPSPENEWPDARMTGAARETKQVFHRGLGWLERVYCINNCGREGGFVTREWALHVVYLCDDCYKEHGALPMQQLEDSVVRNTEGPGDVLLRD